LEKQLMQLSPIPLFGIGNAGKSVNVTAQDRTNLFIEVRQDDEGKHVLTMYGTAGLKTFLNLGASPIRGTYQVGDFIYLAYENQLIRVANNGTFSTLGTLVTTGGRVNFSDNGTQLIAVDGPNGYIVNLNTLVFTQITAPGWPGAETVTFLNGRFVVNKPNSGQWYWSGLYDGLSWDALDFATAESNPDNLVAVIAEMGQLLLFGTLTTEAWGDSGALDNPFARAGSNAIEWGLAARDTLCKFSDGLMFLRKNRLGQVQVCLLNGYNATAVSNPELDYLFGTYGNVSNATAFAYMISGHAFYQINFPTVNVSWLFDLQSQSWSKLSSGGGRHRADKCVQLLEKIYVSDYQNGKLYQLSLDFYTDDGATIVREFTSRHQANGNRMKFNQLWLEFEPGVGLQTGQGTDPQCMMTVSRDGGDTFGNERWTTIGKVGNYKTRALWNRLGQAFDWVFRFRITDPVKVVIVAAWGKAS
jgi:hypothetical protein